MSVEVLPACSKPLGGAEMDLSQFSELEVLEERDWRYPGLWGKHVEGKVIRIVTNTHPVPDNYPIHPEHISPAPTFVGVFGASGLESAGEKALNLAQRRGHWGHFTLKEIGECGGLVEDMVTLGFFLDNGDGTFGFTQGFVTDMMMLATLAAVPVQA
ncbi:hypothetical protein KKC44_04455 [Patescibacteria group bacterium]|nr:hypothetical protein [Patescibacteria group bacterium]MBU2259829.1 hypothetical protein [Patescibacteria group bacterium]